VKEIVMINVMKKKEEIQQSFIYVMQRFCYSGDAIDVMYDSSAGFFPISIV
jgi:hypothetical protein